MFYPVLTCLLMCKSPDFLRHLAELLSDNSELVCSDPGAWSEETEQTTEDVEYFEELSEQLQ